MCELGGPGHTIIMVDTSAAQINNFSVNAKSVFSVQLELADSERSLFFIQNVLSLFDNCLIRIQIRMFLIPLLRLIHIKFLEIFPLCIFFHSHRHHRFRRHISIRIQKPDKKLHVTHSDSGISDCCRRADHRLIFLHIHCRQMYTVRRQMQTVGDHQIDVTVDSSAGIPPSAWYAVLHNDLKLIFPIKPYKFCGVNIKIAVTIRTFSRKCMIDVDKCILIDALKFKVNIFPLVFWV